MAKEKKEEPKEEKKEEVKVKENPSVIVEPSLVNEA
jgi:hypothetical protein